MDHSTDPLREAVDSLGRPRVARTCGVWPNSVSKWLASGMPRSEWTGETDYARRIEREMRVRGFAKRLLAFHAKKIAARAAEKAARRAKAAADRATA